MKAKTIFESLNFNRGGNDPLRKLGIGVGYRLWRESHDKKPLVIYKFHLKNQYSDDFKIYTVTLMYKSKNGNKTGDTVYFSNERLSGDLGPAYHDRERVGDNTFPLSRMANKPEHMFDPAETTFWDKPETFDKEIDHMTSDPRDWFNNMTEEWFDQPFEDMMNSWFRSGNYKVLKTEFIFKE